MKTTVTFSTFAQAFRDMNRPDNFSREGLKALFDFLEDMEDQTGEEYELDVIALCCEFAESRIEEIIRDYSIDLSGDEEEIVDIVEDYLNENTMLVAKLDSGSFVYAQF